MLKIKEILVDGWRDLARVDFNGDFQIFEFIFLVEI